MPTVGAPQGTGLVRPIVLVVDDEPAVVEALRALLAPRLEPVYRVETAASAEEALALVAEMNPRAIDEEPVPVTPGAGPADLPTTRFPVALVISDERMPGRQGTDLLIALRQAPAHRHGGRMIVTGYAGLPSAKKAINEAEVDRYYPKPWDTEGALLPAVRQVLARFARTSGLDECRVAWGASFQERSDDIRVARKAWWEYLHLMGLTAEELGVETPPFEDAEDAGATHVIVERRSPRECALVAAIRVRVRGTEATLDSLAFLPEEANEEVETLAVRTALLEAARLGAKSARTEVPVLRCEVYERLGFGAGTAAPAAATLTLTAILPGGVGAGDAFARRHAREGRQCDCVQKGCPGQDYDAERRGYFCPLDLLEERVPAGFIGVDPPPA